MSSFSFSLLSKKLKKPDGGEKSDAGASGAGDRLNRSECLSN